MVEVYRTDASYKDRVRTLEEYENLPLIQGRWIPRLPQEWWQIVSSQPNRNGIDLSDDIPQNYMHYVVQKPKTQLDALVYALYNRMRVIIVTAEHRALEFSDEQGIIDRIIIIVPEGIKSSMDLKITASALTLKKIIFIIEPHASLIITSVIQGISPLVYCAQEYYIHERGSISLQEVSAITGICIAPKDYHLIGVYAESSTRTYSASSAQDQYVVTTVQDHQAPDTKSNVSVRATVDGSARMIYEGTITISQEATKSIARQQCKALMLSEKSVCHAQPSLEILTDEVQCAHGCAAAYLDDEHMWFLSSRGLSYETVRTMLIEGFYQVDCSLADSQLLPLRERHEGHTS